MDLIHETILEQGPFDGIFGFSQGASMIAAYLLEQATLHPGNRLPVRFAIFASPGPILATDPAYTERLEASPLRRPRTNCPPPQTCPHSRDTASREPSYYGSRAWLAALILP
ncbi:hypothetical protein BJX63DRAFT_40960 [Aspergillus granulosus]|uniref:Serine hydrolase domain-containing protein n=1 Tax=Aspergillus granulosus TaxID=176169 RepID=A0ABR4GYI5_9EURO